MIAIEVDFNHADGRGRLPLADLVAHERTPFADIAASGDRILFVDDRVLGLSYQRVSQLVAGARPDPGSPGTSSGTTR